jgi:hypothetical protein
MKNPVMLEYMFMFDATDTWQHLSQFENDLADFFRAQGFQAEIIKSISGQVGKRVLFIEKVKNPLQKMQANPPGRPKQPGSIAKELSERKFSAPAKEFMGKK